MIPDRARSATDLDVASQVHLTGELQRRLSRTDTFPEPVAELAIGRGWRRQNVEKWARATGRL